MKITRKRISIRGLLQAFGVMAGLGLPLAIWSFGIEPSLVKVRTVSIRVHPWHQEHSGFKIAVLTDLHVGAPHISLEKLRRVVDKTNEQQPDLILILGDLVIHGVVGGHFVEPERIADVLRNLHSPHGVIAVLGNHDWWFDGVRVAKALKDVGIPVLENDALPIKHNGQTFYVGGLADLWTRSPNMTHPLEVAGQEPIIFMTHNPDLFPDVPARVSLTLAGHTHGGQVSLPWYGPPIVPSKYGRRYAAGLIQEGGKVMYVSTGVGTSILPVRFRVPPEILILTIAEREN